MGETRDNDAYAEELLDYEEEEDKAPDSIAQKLTAKLAKRHWTYGASFYKKHLSLDHLLSTYKKPLVSLLNGIVMGGGTGLSMHGRFQIATENAIFAMPENSIGLCLDVGASHFLSRLPGFLVYACFLPSNKVWNNIHLRQFAFTWEMLSWSLLSGSTAFLIGPKRQVTMMLDSVRIYATALYLASMIIALFCALYLRNKLLTLLAISLEFGALIWYSLSYVPFARSMITKVMVACFDTEF